MYTGKRIGEYINELRVRKVAEDLDKCEDSIADRIRGGIRVSRPSTGAFQKVMKITQRNIANGVRPILIHAVLTISDHTENDET